MGNLVQYAQVSKIIYESWADCIEWYLTGIEYEYLGNPNYNSGNEQNGIRGNLLPNFNTMFNEQIEDYDSYTSLFIDIFDDFNQHDVNTNRPDE